MSWKTIRLGDVATFVNGYAFKPSDWSETGLEIIRIQNLTKGSSETNFFDGFVPEKYKVVKGDILISWSATLDIFVWEGNDAWLNQHIFKVVFDKVEINNNYFIYAIKNILGEMRKQVHGATMQHITKGKFDNLEIPLPPLTTQKRIAEILDAADALRRKDQELLKKYDELAQAIFIDMFGDPVKNEKGWEVKRLDEISVKSKNAIVDGPFGSSIKEEDYVEAGIPIIRINNIRDEGYYDKGYKYLTVEKYNDLIRSKVDYNDILIARVGHTIGKICIFNQTYKALLSTTGVAKATIDIEKNNLYFINSQLNSNSYKKYIRSKIQGAGQPYLNLSMIKGFQFILPPLDLQNAFSKEILKIGQIKNLINQEIINSENLFHSLIQKAFNGELVE